MFLIIFYWMDWIFKYSHSCIHRFPWQFCCIWLIYLDSYATHSYLCRCGPVNWRLNNTPSPLNQAFVCLILNSSRTTQITNALSYAKYVSYQHAVDGVIHKLSITRLHQQKAATKEFCQHHEQHHLKLNCWYAFYFSVIILHAQMSFYLFTYLLAYIFINVFVKQADLHTD